jgi:hypothetical protein
MKNKSFVFVIGLFLLAVFVSCGVSNVKVTRENFDKLKTGMDQNQVLEILGKANMKSESDMGELGIIELWHYQLGNKAIDVTFENGKVIDKSWTEI